MRSLSRFDLKNQVYTNHNKMIEKAEKLSFIAVLLITLKGYLLYLPPVLAFLTGIAGLLVLINLFK